MAPICGTSMALHQYSNPDPNQDLTYHPDNTPLPNTHYFTNVKAGNTKGGSITVPLTYWLTGLESAVWQLAIVVFIWITEKSKPAKQEVNSTVIFPPLVFPGKGVNAFSVLSSVITCCYAFMLPVATAPAAIVFEASTMTTSYMMKAGDSVVKPFTDVINERAWIS